MPRIWEAHPGDCLQRIFDMVAGGDTIMLGEGIWREKVQLRVPGVTLIGSGREKTRIVWDDYAEKRHADGREYNTFRTWTMAVTADDVTMRQLSIINEAGTPEKKGQEVAFSVYSSGFTMEDCTLTSTQDTLFIGPLPDDLCDRYVTLLPPELRQKRAMTQRFTNCLIEGTVDFIFGCGHAVFERCEIRSRHEVRGTGYCAAPAHAAETGDGFMFHACRFTREATVPDGSVYLARPWRDFGLASFVNCVYDRHINPVGFDKWNDTHRDHTARFFETPAVSGRVSWINRD